MSQLTRQDVAEVVEDVLGRLTRQDVAEVVEEVLDRVLDKKLDEKLGLKPGETLDEKLGLEAGETLDQKLDRKFGTYIEHIDDKFDSLAEAISLMNTNMRTLARQSDLKEVKSDIKTIKLAVTDTNDDLRHLGKSF